jgi:hypothetical protein
MKGGDVFSRTMNGGKSPRRMHSMSRKMSLYAETSWENPLQSSTPPPRAPKELQSLPWWQQLRGWWYTIAAPPEVSTDASLKQRELVRRGRVASVILLVIIALVVLPIPTAFGNPILLFTLVFVLALDLFALFGLNRTGHVTIAGVLVVIGIELGLGTSVLTFPGGLGPSNLPLFDLMVQAEVVAVAMLAPPFVFLVAAINSIFIVIVLNSGVTTPELAHLVATDAGRIIVQPITLQIAIAAIVLVLVGSANQAIRRADRAEEIAALEQREIERQQREIEQKHQIEEGIQQILQTHVQVSNGNFNARAPLTQENVLWQIAYSLNNLLARFQGYSQMTIELQQAREEIATLRAALQSTLFAEYEVQQTKESAVRLIEYLRQMRSGHTPNVRLLRNGTIMDEVIMELHPLSLSAAKQKPVDHNKPFSGR